MTPKQVLALISILLFVIALAATDGFFGLRGLAVASVAGIVLAVALLVP